MELKNRKLFELILGFVLLIPPLYNYEPVSSRCGPGSGEILVEKALQLLNELKMKKL